jgi:hypothetical protein
MKAKRNCKRRSLIAGPWRRLRVVAKPPNLAEQQGEIRRKIEQLEEFIVTGETRRRQQRARGILPPDEPSQPGHQLPPRYDQASALARERMRVWLSIGIVGALLILGTLWLLIRLGEVF